MASEIIITVDTVLVYNHFHLLFFENELDFISITNIDHVDKNDMNNFFGKPDYEKFIEQRGYGIVTYSINGTKNAKWYFNCFVDIQDKQTIKEIQFSKCSNTI